MFKDFESKQIKLDTNIIDNSESNDIIELQTNTDVDQVIKSKKKTSKKVKTSEV